MIQCSDFSPSLRFGSGAVATSSVCSSRLRFCSETCPDALAFFALLSHSCCRCSFNLGMVLKLWSQTKQLSSVFSNGSYSFSLSAAFFRGSQFNILNKLACIELAYLIEERVIGVKPREHVVHVQKEACGASLMKPKRQGRQHITYQVMDESCCSASCASAWGRSSLPT
jgi:hypothetical protein